MTWEYVELHSQLRREQAWGLGHGGDFNFFPKKVEFNGIEKHRVRMATEI